MDGKDDWKTKTPRPPRNSRSPNPGPNKTRNLKSSVDNERRHAPAEGTGSDIRRSSSTNSPNWSPKLSYSSSSDEILPKHTDPRYLFVKCGFLTEEEVRNVFMSELLPRVYGAIGRKFPVTIIVNKVTCYTMTGLAAQREHAYVYVEPICVANLLLGLDMEGKVRIEKRLVYTPPPSSSSLKDGILEELEEKKEEKKVEQKKKSWADIMEEEDPDEPRYEDVKLPTLVALPRITYSTKMVEFLKENGRKDTDVQIEISSAWAVDAKHGYVTSALWFNGNVPKNITEADIKAKLRPFVSDPITSVQHRFGKEERWDTYPCVRFITSTKGGSEMRRLIIHFDSKTRDAKFIRLLMRHFELKNFRIALDHPPEDVINIHSDDFNNNQARARRR